MGPYTVLERGDDINYVASTPGKRKKSQLCHVNMLKAYHSRMNTELDKVKDDDVMPGVMLNLTHESHESTGWGCPI